MARKKVKPTARTSAKQPKTALAVIPRPKQPRRELRLSWIRREFLREFEASFGNITATCAKVGVGRTTYYRWTTSDTRINRKFQAALAAIKPDDRLFDAAEYVVGYHLAQNNLRAAEIVLKSTKAKKRGFHEQGDPPLLDQGPDELQKLRAIIATRAEMEGVEFAAMAQIFNENYRHLFKPELVEKLLSEANI